MPKGRKRQRGHETRHAKVRIMHSWAWGRAVTHTHTYLQSGIINYSQCESKPESSCCVGQRCKTATAEKLQKIKKIRRENRIKKATAMSWPEPEQRSRAWKQRAACRLHLLLLPSPPSCCNCRRRGSQRYNFSYTCHAPQRTVPNVLRHYQEGVGGTEWGGVSCRWSASALGFTVLCLSLVCNNNSNQQGLTSRYPA